LRPPHKIGIGEAVRAGFNTGLRPRIRHRGADRRRPLARPGALPDLLLRSSGRPMPRSLRGTCPAARSPLPWYRRTISKWGNRNATLVLGIPIRDATSGFYGPSRRHAQNRRVREHALKGLRSRSELCYRVWQPRRPHRAGADHVTPGPGSLEDVVERWPEELGSSLGGRFGPRFKGRAAR